MSIKQVVFCAVSVALFASAFGAPRSKRVKSDVMMSAASAEIGGAAGIVTSEVTPAGTESEVVRVKGKGMGQTEELALKDAYRDAASRADAREGGESDLRGTDG